MGLFAVFMTALLLFVAMLPFHSVRGGDILLYTTPAACLIAGISVLCVALAIRLLRGFEVPLDQLPEFDGPARRPISTGSGSSAVPADNVIEQARRQVKGPAIGLLVTGIFNWVLRSLAAPLSRVIPGLSITAVEQGGPATCYRCALAILLISSLMIVAALKMRRLQAYWLAITASILAIIISPGNLIGLPIGIWALVVLSQREVRAAFAKIGRSQVLCL